MSVLSIGALSVVLAELGLRALYVHARARTEGIPVLYERSWWAAPPWTRYGSVLRTNADGSRAMRADARRTYINLFGPIDDLADVDRMLMDLFPETPAWAESRDSWVLQTNSEGFRGPEPPGEKPPGSLRIVTLGDSWTVGVNVPLEATWPARLGSHLAEASARPVEVVNRGVIGAGLTTGLRDLDAALALSPDVVVIAYAQNDELRVQRGRWRPRRPLGRKRDWIRDSELARLWRYLVRPAGELPSDTIRSAMTGPVDPGDENKCIREDPMQSAYGKSLGAMVDRVRAAGAIPVLLYPNVAEFRSHCVRDIVRAVAEDRGVSLVDAARVLHQSEELAAASFTRQAGLHAPGRATGRGDDGSPRVIFRVAAGALASPVYLMGHGPELGDFKPNRLPMFDDGSHGDEVAGDGIWSREVSFPSPGWRGYAYTAGADAGEWKGIESYRSRRLEVPPSGTWFLAVEEFGRRRMRSDPSHPDEAGLDAIAAALAASITAGGVPER